MISTSRFLCSFARSQRYLITEAILSSNKSQHCINTVSPGYHASSLSTKFPHTQDHVQDTKIHKTFSNKDKDLNYNRRQRKGTNINNYLEKDIDFAHSDPDTFGNLKGQKIPVEVLEGDEGDKEEEMYLEHPPSASQKLRIKQYADLIKEFFQNKKVADAIDVLETRMLKVDRVKPDNYIYNLIISECGRLGYTKKAFQLYNQMKKRALKVTGATYTALFNACANSPWLDDGLERARHLRQLMFEKGYEPNASNYHAMIKAFGRCGDLSTAFILVDEMAEKKVQISDETFNFLFQACITDKEAGFRHALLLWRKMVEKGVKPDLFTYNLLLRCVRDCGLGDLDVTHDVFNRITSGNFSQDNKPIPERRHLLTESNKDSGHDTGSENVALNEVKSLVAPVLENRPNLLAPIPHFGNIIGLSEITRPEDRLILVGGCSGFLEQMKKHKVKPNIKTFTQLLDTIPSTKAAEQALLSAMEKADVHPDIDFYNMLIKKRSLRLDYKSACDVLKLIQRAKLNPDIVTFGVLALGCQTQEEAQCLLEDMKSIGFRMNVEILGAMLRQGCGHFNFEYVLAVMETAIEEEVRPSERFLKLLEKFRKQCWQKIKNKDTELPHIPKEKSRDYFKNGFQKFSVRYNSWLKEVEPEEQSHPWEQFRKKSQEDKSTAKETKNKRRVSSKN
ncbi:pentatricopeptide repeat-containing protein 1, mitochondrial [Periplaneta americana]|uniref:pentatricopeptide repeat-containing protein 1, mitochondrial n=1 Tax=Periplaneta americana TaxID=6978 RepID=UPI0037E7286E